jgi:hypothetical protein
MFKLVKVPSKLSPFLAGFSDLFTRPSFSSFCHITSAIAICNKSKTVYNLHETMADNNEKKGRSSYNWFITNGDWDEDEIAQRKADLFFEEMHLKAGDRILLIIDDTYNEKKGKHTEGVGKFYDHSKGYIWGNSFTTSVLQTKGLFIPHKAKMYIKKDAAGHDFKTKTRTAIEDIIKPLKIPEGMQLMVVFDCAWFSATLIKKCRELGYHVTCQIKSDKKILLDNDESLQVKSFAKRFGKDDFKKTTVNARGTEKSYFIVDQVVRLDKTRQVHLVISKEKVDAEPNYYISTDTDLSPKEILSIYEDRWNIETAHREANQKLGFKDYQLRSKRAIERFIQLVFAIWTGILLVEIEKPTTEPGKRTIGEMIDQIRSESILDLIVAVMELFNLPIPDEGGLLYKLKALGLKLGK